MAERLTKEYYYTWDENGTKKLSYIQKLQNKLGKLEDIMEKYGIESVELLEHIIKKGKVINSVIEDFAKEEYDKIKQDRDTWKRACELACEKLADIYSHCEYELFGDSVDEYRKYCEENGNPLQNIRYCETKYFYQQAKTEGKNNDTNN